MTMHPFHRTELLIGAAGIEKLASTRACVIGLGGVGSHAAEALIRGGIGHLTLVDFDRVCLTNVNRQLLATRDTMRQWKAELMGERAKAINPKADVRVIPKFFSRESADEILEPGFDVVLDCIDNMTAKVALIETSVRRGFRVLSALGAGGRMDPTRVRVSDVADTHTDPFGRLVRDLLRQRGIETGIECVWSDEPPNELDRTAQASFRCICSGRDELEVQHCETRFQVQGSISFLPAIFGFTMAGVAINRILGRELAIDHPEPPPVPRSRPSRNKPSRARKQELLEQVGLGRPPVEPT